MEVAVRIIVMAIGGSLVQTSAINFSLPPTDSVAGVADYLARLGLEPDEPSPWRKVYERLLNWAIV